MRADGAGRPYRMRRRAEQVEATRLRITEAAVRLHTTVGPSETSIAAVAAEAGVTRLTVYRHFRDPAELFAACMAHWAALHPPPDPAAWATVRDLGERARRALSELYAWYAVAGPDLMPIERDAGRLPAAAREHGRAQGAAVVEAILGGEAGRGRIAADGGRRLRAVVGHVTTLSTWHSLVVDQDLTLAEAADLATGWIEAAAQGPTILG